MLLIPGASADAVSLAAGHMLVIATLKEEY